MAGVISTQSYVNPYQWSKQMGGKRKKKKKPKTKAQKMATKRIAEGKTLKSIRADQKKKIQDNAREKNKKFKQTRVQTFGGTRKTSFTKPEQTRIKDAGY